MPAQPLISSLSAAIPAAVAPSPAVAVVLQCVALFGAVGAVVALLAEWRGRRVDRARATAAWSSLGFTVGVAAVSVDAALGALR